MNTRTSLALALLATAMVASACKPSGSNGGGQGPAASVSSSKPADPPPPPPPEDKFPLDDKAIDAVVNPSGATEYTGPTGVVEGVVTVKGDAPAMRPMTALPKECEPAVANHAPMYRAGAKGELADALVGVIQTAGYVRPSRADKVVTIKGCSILPTVIDLSLGQRLLVGNEDGSPYTPTLPTRKIITRLAIKAQSPVPLFLTSTGAFGLTWLPGALPGSDVPSATVFVLPNALHMTTDLDGKFRIANIPVGKARLVVSHLGMPEFSQEIEVKAGGVVKVDVPMTYKNPALAPAPSTSASHPISPLR
jgi:hypothetical protein